MPAPRETEAAPMPERSWQRYRLIADTTTDVVYESDSAGIIQWISPSVHELLGWAPIQLQGRPASDLIHPLDRDRIEALRASFYLDRSAHDDVTCMVSTAAGGYRELRLTTRPLLDAQDTVIGAIVTVTDTHDRDSVLRALATLSQANRALVRATDEATLLQQMCETIVGTGRYLFAWYGRPVDDAQQSVQPIAMAGEHQGYLDEIRISWGDTPGARALGTGHSHTTHAGRERLPARSGVPAVAQRGHQSRLPVIDRAAHHRRRRARRRRHGLRRGGRGVRRTRPGPAGGSRRRPRLRHAAPACHP